MPKSKLGATRAYFIDWLNALRLLWHVFVSSRGSRRTARERRIGASRPAFRNITKFDGFWYLTMSLSPHFVV